MNSGFSRIRYKGRFYKIEMKNGENDIMMKYASFKSWNPLDLENLCRMGREKFFFGVMIIKPYGRRPQSMNTMDKHRTQSLIFGIWGDINVWGCSQDDSCRKLGISSPVWLFNNAKVKLYSLVQFIYGLFSTKPTSLHWIIIQVFFIIIKRNFFKIL